MSNITHPIAHTVTDEWLAAASAGTLSVAKSLVVACQAEVQPEISTQLSHMDDVGGALLESVHGEAVSDDFFDSLQQAVDAASNDNAHADQESVIIARNEHPLWMPDALIDFLERSGITLTWRGAGPGVKRAFLHESATGERLYLLSAKPGLKMPEHAHTGEEWTLVLQGGYHVGETGYARGDLHQEDENCQHQPIIDDHGENCISLVMDEGAVRFSNPILRLLQPFIGI